MEEPDSGRRSPFTSSSNGWFYRELSCPCRQPGFRRPCGPVEPLGRHGVGAYAA